MTALLTATGRDVLFAHWPVDPDALAAVVPEPLAVATHGGSAWVSALALENPGVAPGSGRLPAVGRPFPQLNLRTYVSLDGEVGVYFLSLDSGRRLPAAVGRRGFGLPFRHARMRLDRRGDEVTFRSRRAGDPPAVFRARYRPTGESSRAEPGSVEEFCVEQFRYYVPAPEDRRVGPLRDGGVVVGTIDRDPWELRPAEAQVHTNTLFAAAGLPAPETDPHFRYSPGFEMAVQVPETEEAGPAATEPES